jgi:hypothetical protein
VSRSALRDSLQSVTSIETSSRLRQRSQDEASTMSKNIIIAFIFSSSFRTFFF